MEWREKRILFLDDVRDPVKEIHEDFFSNGGVYVSSYEEAIEAVLKNEKFDYWSLDYDLSGFFNYDAKTGMDFLEWVKEECPRDKFPNHVFIHSTHITMSEKMSEFCNTFMNDFEQLEHLEMLVKSAQEEWTDCYWEHDYDNSNGIYMCSGGNEDCKYCNQVKADAEEAASLANQCLESAREGNWERAFQYALTAGNIEREYGDWPAYGDIVHLCEEMWQNSWE